MTDDIVTRLRNWSIELYPQPYGATMETAADEIERLQKLTSELAQLMMPFALLMTKADQEKVMKAVRGDG